MKLKRLGLVLILTFTTHAFSGNKDFNYEDPNFDPALDFGPAVGNLINAVIKNLTANGPIELISSLGPIDLTELIEAIIGEEHVNPLKGSLSVSSVALIGMDGAEVVNSTLNLNGLIAPINLNFDLNLPRVGIGGNYVIDALIIGILPVRGSGKFYMGIDMSAGGGGDLRVLPPMKFHSFDYNFSLRNIDVNFDGLIGGSDLSEQINLIINKFIDDLIVPSISSIEAKLHVFINAVVVDLLNSIVGELTYQKLLELLTALLKPKP